MPSFLLAIPSAQVDALQNAGEFSYRDDPWRTDRFASKLASLAPLKEGGTLYLATVSMLGFVTVRAALENPTYSGGVWTAAKRSSLRRQDVTTAKLSFAKKMGAVPLKENRRLLRTPRLLTEEDEALLCGGVRPGTRLRTLRIVSTAKPRSIRELDAVRRRQLRAAGKGHDGKNLPPEARLAKRPRPSEPADEATFDGYLCIHEIADETGKVLYDVFVCTPDSGSVFRAGTTKVVAELIQGGMQARDAEVRQELLRALEKRGRS